MQNKFVKQTTYFLRKPFHLFVFLLGCLLLCPLDALADKSQIRAQRKSQHHYHDNHHKRKPVLKGRLMWDLNRYGAFYSKQADGSTISSEIRRAELAFSQKTKNHWSAKLEFGFESNENEVEVNDAYAKYRGWKWAKVTIGKSKEPFGFEELSSTSDIPTLERSMVSSAFAPGRSLGVTFDINSLDKVLPRSSLAIGLFQAENDDDYDHQPPVAITTRLTYAPLKNDRQILHLGLAGSWRDWDENAFQFKEQGELNTADNMILSAILTADSQQLKGVEAAWQYQSFNIQAEYMASSVDQVDGETWLYDGYYVQAGYLLTGEKHQYKKGKFSAIKPAAESGAWELVFRHSLLDLRDNNLGAEASVNLLGVNYYASNQIRIMFNYLNPSISGYSLHSNTDGDAISLRFLYLFQVR